MKFNISKNLKPRLSDVMVGNVYNVRGGSGAKHGHMSIVVAVREYGATVIVIDKDGNIVGSGNYALHYFEDKCPMAFADGIDGLAFDIVSL